jgi:Fe-S cluster assembly protein SufD
MQDQRNIIRVEKDETRAIEIRESGDYVVELVGSGARAEIHAAFLTTAKQQLSVNLFIIHRAPHTSAHTMLKGVAKDQSAIRFFGRIEIAPHCPDVQSFLEERVLLLSDQAKAETIPELEILSDDVKCSHAASISRVPEEHLFYLQSRGLTQAAAEDLIVEGFLGK